VTFFKEFEKEILWKNLENPSEKYLDIVTGFLGETLPGMTAEPVLAYCRAQITGKWNEERDKLSTQDRQRLNLLRGYVTALRVNKEFAEEQNKYCHDIWSGQMGRVIAFEKQKINPI